MAGRELGSGAYVYRSGAATVYEMVGVPAGEFDMGSDRGASDQRPVHAVYLNGDYIDMSEVANAQWNAYARAAAQLAKSQPASHPVMHVTWLEAHDYCQWAGLRLPTQAEWERAASGTDGRVYPWGNDFDCRRGNFDDETQVGLYAVPGGAGCDGYDTRAAVGSSPAGVSPTGTHGMAGDVWEWVSDWYDSEYCAKSPSRNPTVP